ncbi:MAG: helix-turn-helix domain-containing protein [Streptococcaceae bacterium]|nr:helix-turn-helix domain-containing protein [Streptococcaceae bacterium]
MAIYERIQKLTNTKGITLRDVANDLGFSKNYLYTLRTNEPSAKNLKLLADYFEVSVDYLLGRESAVEEKIRRAEIKDDEVILSFDGKEITDNDRRVLNELIEAYLRSQENNQE